jgi:hypothetical protein
MNPSQIQFPLDKAAAKKLRDDKAQNQNFCRQYDFTRRFVALAGQQGTAQVPMPSEGDFEAVGYNIEYEVQNNGEESLFLRFRQQDGGRAWSNDFVPIRSIATPGARVANQPGIRYGYRNFVSYIPMNDVLSIDYDNRTGAEDLEVLVTFTGYIYPVYN